MDRQSAEELLITAYVEEMSNNVLFTIKSLCIGCKIMGEHDVCNISSHEEILEIIWDNLVEDTNQDDVLDNWFDLLPDDIDFKVITDFLDEEYRTQVWFFIHEQKIKENILLLRQ